MAFNFSANQFDLRFQAPGLNNWEYPRFSPPRPRKTRPTGPLADKNGHLLPAARRDGNSFGRYRGTYELPLRITRSFCAHYDACLSGRYKFRDFPRDLCCCQLENRRAGACDKRETLGLKGDPYWQRPKCQSKCEGYQKLLLIQEQNKHCKRPTCKPKKEDKDRDKYVLMVDSKVEQDKHERKRHRKRQVTAFPKTRKAVASTESAASTQSKTKGKILTKTKSQTKSKTKGKPTSSTGKGKTKAIKSKSRSKTKVKAK